ncbi:MAG: hypothetical protein HY760_01335 [Nitrospirae bacterium]|nr:hypothetical protein [Nitrospirota bacterium]
MDIPDSTSWRKREGVDIGSWWFTKWEPVFAYTVIIGGILMGFSLAAQILIPLWEMWLKKRSD